MSDNINNTDWLDIKKQMPDLILDMLIGLRLSGCDSVRELCVLKDRSHRPSPGSRFAYYENEHNDLRGKLDLMLERGCVTPVACDAEPIYRITDGFADHLLDGWPEQRWPDWSWALDHIR